MSWLREVIGEPAWDGFLEQAAGVPAGSRGLLALPYLAGERTPIFDPAARGLIVGLTLTHGQPELLRRSSKASHSLSGTTSRRWSP